MGSIQGQLNLLTGTLFGSIGAIGKGVSKLGSKPKEGGNYAPEIGGEPQGFSYAANETQIPNAYAASVKAVESANEVIASKQNKKFKIQKRLSEIKKEGVNNE